VDMRSVYALRALNAQASQDPPNVTHHQRRLSIRQRRLVHAVLGADARQKSHRQRVFGTRVGRHQVREAGHIIQKQWQPQGTPPVHTAYVKVWESKQNARWLNPCH
jgi:hypothetical protein